MCRLGRSSLESHLRLHQNLNRHQEVRVLAENQGLLKEVPEVIQKMARRGKKTAGRESRQLKGLQSAGNMSKLLEKAGICMFLWEAKRMPKECQLLKFNEVAANVNSCLNCVKLDLQPERMLF